MWYENSMSVDAVYRRKQIIGRVAKYSIFLSMPILAFDVMPVVAGALMGFWVIISACLIPCGSKIEEDGELTEERRRKRVLPVFSHTSLQFLLLLKLDSLDTDCHASLPSVDNQSFFEEPSMGMRAQGTTLTLASGKNSDLLGILLPSTLAM